MKMRMRTIGVAATMLLALSLGNALVSCSDDDDQVTGQGNNGEKTDGIDEPVTIDPATKYATCKGILFTGEDGNLTIGDGTQHFGFTGTQTIKKGVYTLKGWVYVCDGAKLTIEPGTIIKGDKQTEAALIIEPGGQAFMEGTATAPIVMTSEEPAGQRKPGDWGGLIICGRAKNNLGTQQIEGGPRTIHGGSNDQDNSGVYRYIRIEFAGYPFDTDKEINGITFGSVGSGTIVDHLQVSYSNDDSYEWFGGAVNCKYLVAYKGWDDEFDTDNGFSGHVQFGLSVRDPKIADQSQSNGFESDNNADGTEIDPYTRTVFSNITFIGPATAKNKAAGFANTVSPDVNPFITAGDLFPNNGSKLGKFQAAMQIRRSSKLNCYNSVAVGYPVGLIIDGALGATVEYAKNRSFHLKNLIFAGMDALGTDNNKYYKDEYYDKATKTYDESRPSYSHEFFINEGNKVMTENELMLADPKGTGQNYAPQPGSPLLTAGAYFEGVVSSYLDTKVNYIGAFSGLEDTWLDGWTEFNPQTADYNKTK